MYCVSNDTSFLSMIKIGTVLVLDELGTNIQTMALMNIVSIMMSF